MRKFGAALLLLALFIVPSIGLAITLNQETYEPDEAPIQVTCSSPSNSFQVYDKTSGFNNNYGYYACGDPSAPLSFNTEAGRRYAVVELSGGDDDCDNLSYTSCKAQSFYVGEAEIVIIGELSTGRHTDKSTYIAGEPTLFTCSEPNSNFQLFNVTSGGDEDGDNMGNYTCDEPTELILTQVGTYALLELSPDQNCDQMNYTDECTQQDYFLGEVRFQVTLPGQEPVAAVGSRPPQPTIDIMSPKASVVFGKNARIEYATKYTSNTTIHYSDKIADWDHSIVDTSDALLISTSSPAQGPYIWDSSALTPGVAYRVIITALNSNKSDFTQAVSDIFTVDFDAPQFVVKTDPHVTRGGEVMITVESTEELGRAPTTTVTQRGGKSINVVMVPKGISASSNTPTQSTSTAQTSPLQAGGTHFVGTYRVVEGFDGVATIAVAGVDKVGNVSTSIVSGGTFAVGVNPPPAPKVISPRNNMVTSSSTVTLSGTMRADTTVVITVNGVEAYQSTATTSGKFINPSIKLDPKANRGINIVSVAAKDVTGLLSESVDVSIKYNMPPTVVLDAPKADAVLGGEGKFSVQARDSNADVLQFTYQIIPERNYDPALEGLVGKNAKSNVWTTIADSVPTSGFTWNTTEVDDGAYLVRVIASDGIEEVKTEPQRIYVKNTLPIFKFQDGRRTVVGTSIEKVVVSGHVLGKDIWRIN